MAVGPRLQAAVEARKGTLTLSTLAQQGGMRTMHETALEWVGEGASTLVEVERVVGQTVEDSIQPAQMPSPPRILLVDDEEEARVLTRVRLEQEGFEIQEAVSGQAALDILRADSGFSLVVLDLAMPGMDGNEVLREIRGSVDTAALPVLIRTGSKPESEEVQLLDAGADDFLTKSDGYDRFAARVRAIVRRANL